MTITPTAHAAAGLTPIRPLLSDALGTGHSAARSPQDRSRMWATGVPTVREQGDLGGFAVARGCREIEVAEIVQIPSFRPRNEWER